MSAGLSPERLAEIATRAAAAFAGPWFTDTLAERDGSTSVGVATDGDTWIVELGDLDPADAEFIAHARTDVPTLLAEVDRLRAQTAEMVSAAMGESKVRLFDDIGEVRHVRAVADAQWARANTLDRLCREKNERVAELEESPLAWAEQLELKTLDNLLISLAQATDYEPMTGAIDQIHQVLRGFRAAAAKAGEPA